MAWIAFLLILNFIAASQGRKADTHIVYLGNVDESLHPQAVTDSHHDLLETVLGSGEAARESLRFSYRHGFSGFSAHLSEEQATQISRLPNVLSVFPNRNHIMHTTNSWEFLGLYGNGEKSLFGVSKTSESSLLWKKAKFGKDVIIGVVDSGVWPESESFSDDDIGPIPRKWKGICQSGERFNSSHCNRKLIGARFFADGLPETLIETNRELLSPRDVHGHGTHVAATAGGRFVKNANWSGYAPGTAVGGAPNSRIAVYKACWNITSDGTCSDAHILAAFDKGIHDGVDIFSVSISGLSDYFESPTSIGAFHAMRKGIVVVASAGNDQEVAGDGSVNNVAPWIITVGASTQDRAFFADVSLGDNRTFRGLSYTIRTPEKRKYPLVSSALAGLLTSNFSASQLCLPGSLDPEKVRGKIVACLDGAVHPVLKSTEVLQAGGVGTLVLNSRWDFTAQRPEFAVFPYVQVDAKVSRAVLSYINSTSSPVASIRYRITRRNIKPSPVMAPFSSAGPSAVDPDILKPDITAPGVNILAANTQFDNGTAFRFMSGTSMSCPHVTGVVALLKSYRPSWSPAALKSAIVTTAYPFDNLQNTIQNSSLSPATPFNYGGGHINPNAAAHPGLIYDADEQDYIGYLCSIGYNQTQLSIITGTSTKCPDNPWGLNSPSIVISNLWLGKVIYRRVTNVDDDATTYTATVEAPAGISVSVDPPVLQFESKGESKTFQVRFRAEELEDNEFHYGKLRWSNGKYTVTSPIAVRQLRQSEL